MTLRLVYLGVGILSAALICVGFDVNWFAALIIFMVGGLTVHYVDQKNQPKPALAGIAAALDTEPRPYTREPYTCMFGYHIFGLPNEQGWQQCVNCPTARPAPPLEPPPQPPPREALAPCPKHQWDKVDKFKLYDADIDEIGWTYVLQCENCGDMKNHYAYNEEGYE